MEKTEQQQLEETLPLPSLSIWFIKLLSLQSDLLHNCFLSLTSPFTSLLFQEPAATGELETGRISVASAAARAATLFLTRLLSGFLGAAYVCLVLTVLLILAIVLGVGLVRIWVEEPVVLRDKLYFDYTHPNPHAVFYYGGGNGGVPVGHTFYVALVLLVPESEFNLQVGNFQVIAELLSVSGNVVGRSSQPYMLQYRSLPIRMMQTFLNGIPILLGTTTETQIISIPMLKHKEVSHPRTDAIRISLVPRAGTNFLPQLYEAEILMNSKPPWGKELVRRWKWTFCVWTSLYIYIMLLIVVICCFRSIIFLKITLSSVGDRNVSDIVSEDAAEEPHMIRSKERDFSETVRRWKESRRKRKATNLGGGKTLDPFE